MRRGSWAKLSITLATLILMLSLESVVQEAIDDHNSKVRIEQFDRQMIADHGATFSHDWGWGIDHRGRNRHFIFVLCIAAFLLSLWPRTRLISIVPYGLALLLVYQWISIIVRDLPLNPAYMTESPYFLRIASPFEWLLFAVISIAFTFDLVALCAEALKRLRKLRSLS